MFGIFIPRVSMKTGSQSPSPDPVSVTTRLHLTQQSQLRTSKRCYLCYESGKKHWKINRINKFTSCKLLIYIQGSNCCSITIDSWNFVIVIRRESDQPIRGEHCDISQSETEAARFSEKLWVIPRRGPMRSHDQSPDRRHITGINAGKDKTRVNLIENVLFDTINEVI